MKLSRLLFKPRWQDNDAAVRVSAVASDSDDELIAALPELTRSDPDARVRLAALKRLGDYERWRERSTGDSDGDVRRVARSAYLSLLCSASASRPALPRLIAELETLSAAEMETVASTAPEAELRTAALSQVTRPALLAERAIADPAPALRLAALARIDDVAALERIAERARRIDKNVSRLARERLDTLRIGAGDAGAIATRARLLCERLESLMRAPTADLGVLRAQVQAEWSALGDSMPAALRARFAGAMTLLDRIEAGPAAEPATPAVASMPAAADADADRIDAISVDADSGDADGDDADEDEAGPAAAPEVAVTIVSQARFEAALVAASEQARREREQRQQRLQELDEPIAAYERALDSGDSAGAHALHAQLAETAKALDGLPAAINQRLAPLHERFAELRRWQHWSNQRRRRALCDEIEQLAATHAHPDAVATRVREARVEWQHLDTLEGISDDAGGLGRRFHGVCQRALKPARGYFEKRAATRDTRGQELEALLTRASTLAAEGGEVKAFAALRSELSAALRSLDAVDPRARSGFARRIKEVMAALSNHIGARAKDVESGKARLIEQAEALSAQPDRGAVRTVRELQQKWTALGEGLRSTDQRQWRAFRAACDRVFAGLDAERNQREAEAAAHGAAAQALLAEANAVLTDPALAGDGLAAKRRDLDTRWRALAEVDRGIERRFRETLAAIAARETQQARAARLAHYDVAVERHQLLRQVETGAQSIAAVAAAWQALPAAAAPFAALLSARHERAAAGAAPAAAADASDEVRAILVELEFAAGLPSPASDRQRRMDYQVRRLSARMRGSAAAADPHAEFSALLARWLAIDAAPPAQCEQRFAEAARAALALLP
jgi:hypothetical protein